MIKMNINAGGGVINHIVVQNDRVYRFVEDGLMIYKYAKEEIDIVIDKILEQEYDDNFIVTLEYDINTFNKINENNIYNIIEKCVEVY